MGKTIEHETGIRTEELTYEELNHFAWMLEFLRGKQLMSRVSADVLGRSNNYLAGVGSGNQMVSREIFELTRLAVEEIEEHGALSKPTSAKQETPNEVHHPSPGETLYGDALSDLREANKLLTRTIERLEIASKHAPSGFGSLGIREFSRQLESLRKAYFNGLV